MKAIKKLYGYTIVWTEGASTRDSAAVDLYAPYLTWADLAQAVVEHYALDPDEEVDVIAGAVRPMRVWEFARPTLDEVLTVMRQGFAPLTVPAGAMGDAAATVTLRAGVSAITAEYRLHWHLRKWAEAHLTSTGWWLVDPRWVTVGGDATVEDRETGRVMDGASSRQGETHESV
jgi:hypothetical protein